MSPSWRIAAGAVAAQGVAVVVLSVVYGVTVRDQGHGVSAWLAAAFGVVFGVVVVALLARALLAGSRGAVAPTILLELICAGEAYYLAQEHHVGYAAVLAATAVVGLVATVVGLRALPLDE